MIKLFSPFRIFRSNREMEEAEEEGFETLHETNLVKDQYF